MSFNLSPQVNELFARVCVGIKRWATLQCFCFTCFACSQVRGYQRLERGVEITLSLLLGWDSSRDSFGPGVWKKLR